MSKRTIFCTVVGGDHRVFERLHEAMLQSILQNVPNHMVFRRSLHCDVPKREAEADVMLANVAKTHGWLSMLTQASPGDHVVLCDCDTLWLQSPAALWEGKQFDVAVTKRTGRLAFNGGIVYCTAGRRAEAFLRAWYHAALRVYDSRRRAELVRAHGGCCQAALIDVLADDLDVQVQYLPTRIWNAVDTDWGLVDGETIAVHIKGQLRRWCLDDSVEPEQNERLESLIRMWRQYDHYLSLTA